uniref:AlNc14C179G8197 protein n=1 Tax=Albugo laibachii Nc14 TaxID=890382 RepID=F0WEM9_9STRA|nr:AlNc14C75G5079 [Albugo laibachii Nc14]CCA23093.1 AlNc14C179G8197 [Albugo laibachii Nc14]|eukprot:CCA23093.1 AlNc14C179G8197 [Albugo laibachii Nc14]
MLHTPRSYLQMSTTAPQKETIRNLSTAAGLSTSEYSELSTNSRHQWQESRLSSALKVIKQCEKARVGLLLTTQSVSDMGFRRGSDLCRGCNHWKAPGDTLQTLRGHI